AILPRARAITCDCRLETASRQIAQRPQGLDQRLPSSGIEVATDVNTVPTSVSDRPDCRLMPMPAEPVTQPAAATIAANAKNEIHNCFWFFSCALSPVLSLVVAVFAWESTWRCRA